MAGIETPQEGEIAGMFRLFNERLDAMAADMQALAARVDRPPGERPPPPTEPPPPTPKPDLDQLYVQRYPTNYGRGNTIFGPPWGPGRERPRKYGLAGDPDYRAIPDGVANKFEYNFLCPLVYYLQNYLVHLESIAPPETPEEAAEETSWKRMVNTIRELADMAKFRKDQVVTFWAVRGTAQEGLVPYMEAAGDEGQTVRGHVLSSETAVNLIKAYNEKATAQSLKDAAKMPRRGVKPAGRASPSPQKPGTARESSSGAGRGRPAQP